MPVASLPMYDMPEAHKAFDSLWAGLARHMKRAGIADVPETIAHDRSLRELWNDGELWLSQCCGYDLVKGYAGKLRPVATPHYGAPGCKAYKYASVVVVAEESEARDVLEMRGAVCVVNGFESHSGMNALRALVAPKSRNGRFFSQVRASGAHAASLEMIKRGEADVAAIDCVTYALLREYRPGLLDGTRKLGRTYRAPGIPFVARWDQDGDTLARMRAAIFNAFADPDLTTARQALFLKDIEELPLSVYEEIVEFEKIATRHGYPNLN
jgi:ABC-type phosphate/phosphonate transport system substrate-binding protein